MDRFTELTVIEFFRRVGQPSAGARFCDYLRESQLVLTAAPPQEITDLGPNATPADVERFVQQHSNGKK